MKKLVLLLLFSGLAGCLAPVTPDDVPPDPEPVRSVQQEIRRALKTDQATRDDCWKVYAIYRVMAEYLESDEMEIETAQELKQVLQSVIAQSQWPDHQYPTFSEVLRNSLNEILHKTGTILDRRAVIVKRFREISRGGKEAM